MYISIQLGTMDGAFMYDMIKVPPLDHVGGILFCECTALMAHKTFSLLWLGRKSIMAVTKLLY
jgi:hypothetical protein